MYYIVIRYIELRYIARRYILFGKGGFIIKKAIDFLPLTETTYLILSTLWRPAHGYGIMQTVDKVTNSRISLAPGTLYGALGKLAKDNLIEVTESHPEADRKKVYVLTPLGKEVVKLEFNRLQTLVTESEILLGGVNFE